MPELPELEAFKYIVETQCLRKKIKDIALIDSRVIKGISDANFKKQLINHAFSSVVRRGKYLIIKISSSDFFLVMHFGLTGFLVYSSDPYEKIPFSVVNFFFNSDAILHWISIRKFEKIWLVKNLSEIKGLSKLGPDPFDLSKKEFLELIERYKTKNIKAFLMDQSAISGIGNEYSDEILFQSGIDPHHTINDLSLQELSKLYVNIKKVLKYAISIRIKDIKKMPQQNFLSAQDRQTFKSSYLQAHRHIDMICPKNKNHTLKKATIAGRTSYYCPKDQK